MKNIKYSNPAKIILQIFLLLVITLHGLGNHGLRTVYALGPLNDNWASAKNITSVPFSETISTASATQETGEPQVNVACDGRLITLGNNTVWYKYTPGTTRYISFDTIGSDYDTYIAVWTGNAVNNLTLVGCDDDNDLDFSSQFSFNAQAGVTYYIQVAKYKCPQTGCTIPEPACPIDSGTTCSLTLNVKYQTFVDVPPSYWAYSYVERLFNAGITGGCSITPPLYCPETTVTRDQMAVFLLRGIYGAAYKPPAVGVSTGFGDVPTNYWSAAWIKQLAAEGITGGCGSGNYCPSYPVTRDQMAVFLLRSKYGSAYNPPAVGAGTGFGDVPTNHWAAAWIKQLVAEGITSGCGSGNYCPGLPVSRSQMAVFLVRTFNLP